MYPTTALVASPLLPPDATFWTPKRSDLGEGGFGFFHDVWPIFDVKKRDAESLIRAERDTAFVIGETARDEVEFDLLARSVEHQELQPDVSREQGAAIGELINEGDAAPLEALELGVAGLTYALASARMFPAASCRGHPRPRAWSDWPVVYVAANRHRAELLQPLVEGCGCELDIDSERPDLLVIRGSSILGTMALAQAVMEARAAFHAPQHPRGPRRRTTAVQGRLFEHD